MVRDLKRLFLVCIGCLAFTAGGGAQPTKAGDLSKEPTLYVIPYAHLDTQWNWEYPTTINRYILNTMRLNFDLIEKYPHYIFNFSGANRYRMMKEYYPADYQKVKKYVAAGRWFPAGSSWEENDVNSPNAESVIRQILFGKQYFRKEFGKTSAEYMLPDCFGFPASLPSILVHTGIKGFSTQKLSSGWQPAPKVGGPTSPEKSPEGIPFNVGLWQGTDGKSVIAALNPESYSGNITFDLSKSPAPPSRDEDWPARVKINGDLTGVYADYHYYGTGDTGGSPREQSIALMEAIVTKDQASLPAPRQGGRGQQQTPPPPPTPPVRVGDGPLRVIQTSAEQMFLDLKPEMTTKFPTYKGDLELINHSAGSITSQTYMKRWNRKNELLADAAEKASVAAELLGGRRYPQQRLNDAWGLVLGGQFHDIIPGTSTPKAYEYSWNDEVVAMNQFAGVLTSASEAVASALNTQAKGEAIVVYNPLAIAREDVVEANVKFASMPKAVRVTGPDGKDVPAQLAGGKVLFLAKVPSAGYAVYDVQPAAAPAASTLKVSESALENARYAVKVDSNGDITSVFDKLISKELLSAPIRLAVITDNPRNWPAWNMDYDQEIAPPRTVVSGPAQIRIVEKGPARVAVEVTRQAEDSKFVQTIRLSAGDAGNRVEIGHVMDWMGKEANLKAVFPLTPSNENATYNWDIGTIQRPTRYDRQFEVATHQWIDLTDKSGAYGVTVLTDCKYGSDKTDDKTIRLTLVRSPGVRGGYQYQATQDWGHHDFVYGLAGHKGDFREGQTDWQAQRLNQPLIAFSSQKHAGALGKTFSLMSVNNSRIRVLAVKKAEQSEEVVVRMVELDGKPASVQVGFAVPIAAAREINGAEEPVGPAIVQNGKLATSFTAFQPRTFALRLGAPAAKVAPPKSRPLALSYDLAVASNDEAPVTGGFDDAGDTLPAEMLPSEIAFGGVQFKLGPAKTGASNAMAAKGQIINLPAGKFNRVYVLAASANGDQKAALKIGDKTVDLNVENWGGFVGQWDTRTLERKQVPAQIQPGQQPRTTTVYEYKGKVPGYIKRAEIAWFASHHHSAEGKNQAYEYSYLFAYPVDVPPGAKTLTLPNNDKIRILAISVVDEGPVVTAAAPLYDVIENPEVPATLAAR
jgi:alpha-mannosidase